MLTIANLLFLFISMLALASMLVLLVISPQKRHRIGYAVLMVTFGVWDWFLLTLPRGTATGWLYLMPLIWLILIFRYGFPVTTPQHFPPQQEEPHDTQEYLQGARGTRQALTFYFLLLVIGLIALLVFLYTAQLYS